jgi:hypothetical protein
VETRCRYEMGRKGAADINATLDDLLNRIECEYREMPGMCVTTSQAKRLWRLDSTTCSSVLMMLVERGILRRTRAGTELDVKSFVLERRRVTR